MAPQHVELSTLLALPAEARLEPLTRMAATLVAARAGGEPLEDDQVAAVTDALVALLESGVGDPADRVALGEALGALGDPRLSTPNQPAYWATTELDGYRLRVARFPVTSWEWRRWIDQGGYDRDEHWTPDGLAWRNSGAQRWAEYAQDAEVQGMLLPNQPVIGVNWFEAIAYARSFGARLPERAERSEIVRGSGKRPYPWGEPFGMGNANTREEVLSRPCAVGLFRADCTPEGIFDLAGNVAEWNQDEVGDKRIYHPGSWRQPSMAAWAKALALRAPDARGDDLGLRLVTDL